LTILFTITETLMASCSLHFLSFGFSSLWLVVKPDPSANIG
jgi:hypothetical protein